MDGTAIILSGGLLQTPSAKTAHGLIRGTARYKLLGVIDPAHAGADAGSLLDGVARNIPVFENLAAAMARQGKPDYCIVGVAVAGGMLPDELLQPLEEALSAGIHVVNGLHEYLSEHPALAAIAARSGAVIHDIRKPKPARELHFWTGDIYRVETPKIAVLGADCAIGKRTTARMIVEAAREAGYSAEMIYTGQTGWMQGNRYGFIFDATLNDFVSGELEHAILRCYEEANPDLIVIEGQSALRNPSGPAGAEWLLSADADAVVLQYAPARRCFKGWDQHNIRMHSLESEIGLIGMYGVPVRAVTLNTAGLSREQAQVLKDDYESMLGIPVALPLEEGLEPVMNVLLPMIAQ